jgi:rhamnogalacturonyl hydrolase YesR
MLAYTIYKGIKAGWLDKKYKGSADKMRAATYTKIDKYGLIHDASSSPGFNRPGTSTECQAFFLLMEGAYQKLNK